MTAATVVVLADVIQLRAGWDAEQEVAEVVAGVRADEFKGAVVVGAEEAQWARPTNRAHVRPELEDMASLDPRQVVVELDSARLVDASQAIDVEACEAVEIDLRNAVEENVLLDVIEAKRVAECLALEGVRAPEMVIRVTETELVQQRGPDRVGCRSDEHAHALEV